MDEDLKGYAKSEVKVDAEKQELSIRFDNGSGFSMSVDPWWKELSVWCWVDGYTPESRHYNWHMPVRYTRISGNESYLTIEDNRRRFELWNRYDRLSFCLYDDLDRVVPDFKLELGGESLLADKEHLKQFQEFLDGCHPV